MKKSNNKKRSGLILALCLLSVLLVALIGLIVVLETRGVPEGSGETTLPAPVETTQVPTETTEATEAPPETTEVPEVTETQPESTPAGDMIELDTPYCTLYFPILWEDHLHINPVEEDTYRLEFGCRFEEEKVYRLFDITFGAPDGIVLGTVTGAEGEKVPVSIRFYEAEKGLEKDLLETFLAMQEDANRLIALLPLAGSSQEQKPLEDVLIQTPFCQLTYPGQWEEYLLVEHGGGREYVVDFFAEFEEGKKIPLFTLKFSTETENAMLEVISPEGTPVGVRVKLHEIEQEDLSEAQLETVYAMQDALNELLDNLSATAAAQTHD